ncbi:MAG: hypothetical protein ACRDRG_05330 [Pseudonocardiaceae bacterium]
MADPAVGVGDFDVGGDASTQLSGGTAEASSATTASTSSGWHFQLKPGTWQQSENRWELTAEISGDAWRESAGPEGPDSSLPVTGQVILALGSAPAAQSDTCAGLLHLTPIVDVALWLSEVFACLARTAANELNKMAGRSPEPPTQPISGMEIQLTVGCDVLGLRSSEISAGALQVSGPGSVSSVTLQLRPGENLVWRTAEP